MRFASILLMCIFIVVGTMWSEIVHTAQGQSLTLTYLGHSCFHIESADGTVIVIDPYDNYVPYPALPTNADIVLSTHDHVDHGATHRVGGNPTVIRGLNNSGSVAVGQRVIEGIPIRTIASSHGTYQGTNLGSNAIFAFVINGVNVAHLGDLGVVLNAEQIEALSEVEVLLIPVGGLYTIDAAEAIQVVQLLPAVRVVIPIHFVTPLCPWDLDPVDKFLNQSPWPVKRLEASQVELSADSLPEATEVWLFDYKT